MVIRGQKFTAAQYQAAAELFGELMEDQNRRYLVDGLPLVSVLSNRHKDSKGNPAKVGKNATWHTDHTNQERPPKFTMLYPVALPDKGGGTSICNMRAAYDALPEDWKQRITDMKTACSLISSARFDIANPDILRAQQESKVPPTIQPLVRTHPERGTKAIWFHKSKTENIVGMEPEATQRFLDELLEIAIRPEFVYVHDYKPGDMLIVDNRSAMHKAGFDYDHSQHRMLYRILVRGDRPF
jgi:taurine dioxygenase